MGTTRTSRLALGAVCACAAVAAAGCGGRSAAPDAPLQEALRRSPYTYFAFTNALYWGRPVHVVVDRLRVSRRDPRVAGAVLTPVDAAGKPAGDSQLALLRRGSSWRVVRAQDGRYSPFACRLAAPGVIRELFGRCDPSPYLVSPLTSITGPRADRQPTAAERAGIVAANRAALFPHGDGCIRYGIRVSRVDLDYAVTRYRLVGKVTGCDVGNGVSLMRRLPDGRWRIAAQASDPFACTQAPPGVVRSLDGICSIYGPGP